MWSVSDAFLRSIPAGGRIAWSATVAVDSQETELQVSDLSIALQEGTVRRTASITAIPNLAVGQRTDDLYDIVSTELATFTIRAGFYWGSGSEETVPVFTGRASRAASSQGAGAVTITASDYNTDVAAVDCSPAIVQDSDTTRRDAIKAIIAYAFPGAVIVDTSTDAGTLGSEQTWSGKAWDAISAIATDAGIDVSCGPDGRWYLRDTPVLGNPVRIYRMGPSGTVKSMDRERPLDKLYNHVIVTPSTTDGSQDWDSVEVDITDIDPTARRRPALAGLRTKTITSPTATEVEARAVARLAMLRAMGQTETLSTSMFLDPTIDLYDTVQIVGRREANGGIVSATHVIDGANFQIVQGGKAAWSATVSTRNVGGDG